MHEGRLLMLCRSRKKLEAQGKLWHLAEKAVSTRFDSSILQILFIVLPHDAEVPGHKYWKAFQTLTRLHAAAISHSLQVPAVFEGN